MARPPAARGASELREAVMSTNTPRRKPIVLLVLGIIAALSVTMVQAQRTLVIAQPAGASQLDPLNWGASHAWSIVGNYVDTLVKRDGQGGPLVPNLATSWEYLPGDEEDRWRFSLREDVVFHNGERFDAESVRVTIEEFIDPATPGSSFSFLVPGTRGVEVVDEFTVDIITNPNFYMFLPALEQIGMVPPAYYREVPREVFILNPVGTGPYKVVNVELGQSVEMVANQEYWGGRPEFDRVEYRIIPEASTRLAELRNGRVHIATDIPPSLIESIDAEPGIRIEAIPGWRVMFFKLRYDLWPTDNLAFRQAVNYAVDKQAISDFLFGGYAEPISQAAIEGFTGFNPDLEPYPYDPDRARALLAESGYDGTTIVVEGPSARFTIPNEVVELVTGYLEAVGINARFELNEDGIYLQNVRDHTSGHLWYNGFANAAQDVERLLTFIVLSTSLYTYFDSPEIDAIIHELNRTVDVEERQRLGAEAMRLMHEDAGWLFMFQQPVVAAVSDSIDFTPHPFESYLAIDASPRD